MQERLVVAGAFGSLRCEHICPSDIVSMEGKTKVADGISNVLLINFFRERGVKMAFQASILLPFPNTVPRSTAKITRSIY